MATVPVPRTWAAGDLTTTIFNGSTGIKGPLQFLLDPPRCRLYQTTLTTIPNATATAILFNAEEDDTDSMHSTSTNTSRIVCNAAGLYTFVGQVGFAPDNTGYRRIDLRKNGSATPFARVSHAPGGASSGTALQVTGQVSLAVGDYVELYATQTSGGNLDTVVGNDWTKFSAIWSAVS